jgi:hypothetical protein
MYLFAACQINVEWSTITLQQSNEGAKGVAQPTMILLVDVLEGQGDAAEAHRVHDNGDRSADDAILYCAPTGWLLLTICFFTLDSLTHHLRILSLGIKLAFKCGCTITLFSFISTLPSVIMKCAAQKNQS